MVEHRYSYDWSLKDADFTRDKGTVFSCFACGGGSTMGYKLAGNSIVVAPMALTFENIFYPDGEKFKRGEQLTLF